MNKFIKYIPMAVMAFGLGSCADDLDITPDGSTAPFAGASVAWSVAAIVAAAAGVAAAFVGKAKDDWKVWGAIGCACVLVSAIALRVVFYMTGVSVYPFF